MKTTTLFCILATQTISPPLGSPAVASSWVLQNKVLAIWSYNFGSDISLNWDMLIQFTTLSEGKWQPGRTSFCVFPSSLAPGQHGQSQSTTKVFLFEAFYFPPEENRGFTKQPSIHAANC